MVNFYNTLLVIVTVNYGEFLKNTLSNCDGKCGEFLKHTLSNTTIDCGEFNQGLRSDCSRFYQIIRSG